MADHTHIEWTDATWNPITGCSVVSAGCKHCYAMKLAGTRLQHHPSRAGLTVETKAGPVWNGQVRFNEAWLDQPLKWKRPRRIFVCAHGDLFHENVPDQWIDAVFAVMSAAQQHTFQVLTKRADRMRRYCSNPATLGRIVAAIARMGGRIEVSNVDDGHPGIVLPNAWLGVSVEDQAAADERIPLLLATPAAVRWISAEPLLGPVDLTDLDGGACRDLPSEEWLEGMDDDDNPPAMRIDALAGEKLHRFGDYSERCPRIDWVVAGGESGPGARPMHPDWARSLRDQCAEAGVPFLFKQWGAHGPARLRRSQGMLDHTGGRYHYEADPTGAGDLWLLGKKAAGRLLDGVQHDGYPEPR